MNKILVVVHAILIGSFFAACLDGCSKANAESYDNLGVYIQPSCGYIQPVRVRLLNGDAATCFTTNCKGQVAISCIKH